MQNQQKIKLKSNQISNKSCSQNTFTTICSSTPVAIVPSSSSAASAAAATNPLRRYHKNNKNHKALKSTNLTENFYRNKQKFKYTYSHTHKQMENWLNCTSAHNKWTDTQLYIYVAEMEMEKVGGNGLLFCRSLTTISVYIGRLWDN